MILQEDKIQELIEKYEEKNYSNVYEVSSTLSKSFETIEIVVNGQLQRIYFRSNSRRTISQRMKNGNLLPLFF